MNNWTLILLMYTHTNTHTHEKEFQGPSRFWPLHAKIKINVKLSLTLTTMSLRNMQRGNAVPWIPNLNTRWYTPWGTNPNNHWQRDWVDSKPIWTQWWRHKSPTGKNESQIQWSASPWIINWSTSGTSLYVEEDITTKFMLSSILFSQIANLYYINNSAGKSSLVGKLVCVPYFCTDTDATSHDRFTISFIGNSG